MENRPASSSGLGEGGWVWAGGGSGLDLWEPAPSRGTRAGASHLEADRMGWRHLLSPARRGLAGARCWVFRSLADRALPEDRCSSPARAGVGAGSCQGLP